MYFIQALGTSRTTAGGTPAYFEFVFRFLYRLLVCSGSGIPRRGEAEDSKKNCAVICKIDRGKSLSRGSGHTRQKWIPPVEKLDSDTFI